MSNSKLSARSHAYLFAAIAKQIVDSYGETGRDIIRKGVIHYGKQRGSRMRQRALREGAIPDPLTYIIYGEWAAEPGEMEIDMPKVNPDIQFLFKKCPWCDVWKEKGLLEKYGYLYCKYVDEAIAAGFNPELQFDTLSTRGCGAQVCDMRIRNAFITKDQLEELQKTTRSMGNRNKRPWDYHCAHLYKALWDVIVPHLGIEGEKLLIQALEDFSEEFGEEAAMEFLKLVNSDFTVAD